MASHGYLNGQPHFSNNLLIVLLFYTFDPNQNNFYNVQLHIKVLRNVIWEIMVFATVGIFSYLHILIPSNIRYSSTEVDAGFAEIRHITTPLKNM